MEMYDQPNSELEKGTEPNYSDSEIFNSDEIYDDNDVTTSRPTYPRFNSKRDIHNLVSSLGMIFKSANEVKKAVVNHGIK